MLKKITVTDKRTTVTYSFVSGNDCFKVHWKEIENSMFGEKQQEVAVLRLFDNGKYCQVLTPVIVKNKRPSVTRSRKLLLHCL